MIAQCTNCEKITDIDFRQWSHGNLEETYFECEHCRTHYTCFVTDERVQDMQKRLQSMRKSGTGTATLQEMQRVINERMEVLKNGIQA